MPLIKTHFHCIPSVALSYHSGSALPWKQRAVGLSLAGRADFSFILSFLSLWSGHAWNLMQLFLIRMLFFVVSHHFQSGGKGSLYVLIGASFSGILLPLPFGHTYLNMILLVNPDVLCDL